jgi:hypothetical protein
MHIVWAYSIAGSQKARCIALDAINAEKVFFPAMRLKLPSAVNASRRQSLSIQLSMLKRYAPVADDVV